MVKLYYKGLLRNITFLLLLAGFTAGQQEECFAQPLNGSYTINKSLPATGTNFTSFSALFNRLALSGVSGTVQVSVANGPYNEQVIANEIAGVSATNTITINGNSQVLTYAASTATDPHTLRFNGADYVIIKNLTVEAAGTRYAWGVHYMNNSDYNNLEDCTVSVPNCTSYNNTEGQGIVVGGNTSNPFSVTSAAKGLKVQGCIIKGSAAGAPWHGIVINPQSSVNVAAGIIIKDNQIADFRSVGIYLTNANDVTVESNRISRPLLASISDTYGIEAINAVKNIKITRNRIYECFTSVTSYNFFGIRIENATDLQVVNNAIYNNNGQKEWYGISLRCSPGTTIAHNTISNDNQSSSTGVIYGFYHNPGTCSSSGSVFKNNIISLNKSGTATRYAIFQNGASIAIDYNSLYVRPGSNSYYGWANATGWQSFADWQSATGAGAPFDAHSVSVNPGFTNIATGNLTPETILLDGAGDAMGISTDMNNTTRDILRPDPGAFEFTINANVNAIYMKSATACQNDRDSVKVRIKNNSPFVISGFDVVYSINNVVQAEEPYPGTIQPGDSGFFVFSLPVTFSSAGAYSIHTHIEQKPDFGPFIVNVSPAPAAGSFLQGSLFKGIFSAGDSINPDIVAFPDTVVYQLTGPAGLKNPDYGLLWAFHSIKAQIKGGGNIGAGDTATKMPVGNTSAELKFMPSTLLTDKRVILQVIPYSLITGCKALPVQRELYIPPRAVINFSQVNVCAGISMPFINNSSILKGGLRYHWKFGDGDTSNLINPAKIYKTPGNYTVTLYGISDYGHKDSFSRIVTVYANPVADFSYANKCEGIEIPFIQNSVVTNGSPAYSWNLGDGNTSSQTSPTHLYGVPGIYMVSLKITDALGCSSAVTKPVTFSQKPQAAFSFPALLCTDKTIQFTNNSTTAGTTGYTWLFGDGDSAQARHVDHTYTAAGTYNVTLRARNQFDCVDTITKQVTLLQTPNVDFALSSRCAQVQVVFTNNTVEPPNTAVEYTWDLGDLTVEKSKNIVHTYLSIGEYQIILKAVSANQCHGEKKLKLEFFEKPLANFALQQSACANTPVKVANSSSITNGTLSYWWSFGQGDVSADTSPTTVYPMAGSYMVKLHAISGTGCLDSAERIIQIGEVPNSNFIVESGNTADGRMVFTPAVLNGSGNYNWLYGDGQSGHAKVRHEVMYAGQGLYKVSLQVVGNHCNALTTKTVSVYPLGVRGKTQLQGIQVFPSPSNGQFIITMPEGHTADVIEVYNQLGSLVYSVQKPTAEGLQYPLDLSALDNGIYIVSVSTKEHYKTIKISILK